MPEYLYYRGSPALGASLLLQLSLVTCITCRALVIRLIGKQEHARALQNRFGQQPFEFVKVIILTLSRELGGFNNADNRSPA